MQTIISLAALPLIAALSLSGAGVAIASPAAALDSASAQSPLSAQSSATAQPLESVQPSSQDPGLSPGADDSSDSTTSTPDTTVEKPTTPHQTSTITVEDSEVHILGLTWRGEDPRPQYRVLSGDTWSTWKSVDTEDGGPDTDSAEGRRAQTSTQASEAISVTDADQVQFSSANPTANVSEMTIQHVSTPVTSQDRGIAASGARTASAAAASAAPKDTRISALGASIVTRKQWGADEGMVKCTTERSSSVKGMYVHHTSGSNSYTRAQAPAIIRGYLRFHTEGRGWCDLGYNYLVDRFGTIYEGRAKSITEPVVGAHASGFNRHTLGVSVMGTFNSALPPKAARDSLTRVIAWKANAYAFNPTGSMTLTSAGGGSSKFAEGKKVTLKTVAGHRDTSYTDCPGAKLYSYLPTLRKGVATMQASLPKPQAPANPVKPPAAPAKPPAKPVAKPVVKGAIGAYWKKTSARLGAPMKNEVKLSKPSGSYQQFAKGRVYYSKATGARTVTGGMLTNYAKAGWEKRIGFPKNEQARLKGRSNAWNQAFQNGELVYSSKSPTYGFVKTGMLSTWKKLGRAASPVGIPNGVQRCGLAKGGCYQNFSKGKLYWSKSSGTRWVNGRILKKWASLKYERGRLGYPTSNPVTTKGTTTQKFAKGTITLRKNKAPTVRYKR